MNERVSVIRGKRPFIFVAPHGADDPKTTVVAEESAKACNGWAIINRGFMRSEAVDVVRDQASCHRIDHILQPVVEDEFLIPLAKAVAKCSRSLAKYTVSGSGFFKIKNPKQSIVISYLYSCSDKIHKMANDKVGVVLGYGKGKNKDSLTCSQWRKQLFSKLYDQYENGNVYEGQPGGKLAARGSNNINQYYRMFVNDPLVETMQLVFPESSMATAANAIMTGMILGSTMHEMWVTGPFDGKTPPRFI